MMLKRWVTSLPWNLIREVSRESGVDPYLIAAVVQAESGGDTYAVRYEHKWRYLYETYSYAELNDVTQQTEESLQKHSWGLMQVMGSVARELAFDGPLPRLCEPTIGLALGAKKLKELKAKYHVEEDVIASYNAGSVIKKKSGVYINEIYVDRVCHNLRDLRALC